MSLGIIDDSAPAPPGAWLLPYEDPLPKSCIERDWYLGAGGREVLFPHNLGDRDPVDFLPTGPRRGANTSGEIRPSIWWEGRAVGRWELRGTAEVAARLHAPVGAAARVAVEEALHALAAFWSERLLPLSGGAAGGLRPKLYG